MGLLMDLRKFTFVVLGEENHVKLIGLRYIHRTSNHLATDSQHSCVFETGLHTRNKYDTVSCPYRFFEHFCRLTDLTVLVSLRRIHAEKPQMSLTLLLFPPTWQVFNVIKTCAEVSVLDHCSDMIKHKCFE